MHDVVLIEFWLLVCDHRRLAVITSHATLVLDGSKVTLGPIVKH